MIPRNYKTTVRYGMWTSTTGSTAVGVCVCQIRVYPLNSHFVALPLVTPLPHLHSLYGIQKFLKATIRNTE